LISFQHDINKLLKAAGETNTALDPTRSIEQCLEMFAVGTDLPKPPPRPPNPHDLGLLCEKCWYDTPAMKAENAILSKEEKSVDMSNFQMSAGGQCAEAKADYFSAQQSVDALSVVFGMPEFCRLIDAKSDGSSLPLVPIGFKLLCDRASPEIEQHDYNKRSQATSKVADRWKTVLLEWTKERRHPNWNPQLKTVDSINDPGDSEEDTVTNKRKRQMKSPTQRNTHITTVVM
jgi:hypothetical protein